MRYGVITPSSLPLPRVDTLVPCAIARARKALILHSFMRIGANLWEWGGLALSRWIGASGAGYLPLDQPLPIYVEARGSDRA